MSRQFIGKLQRVFSILGWLSILATAITFGVTAYQLLSLSGPNDWSAAIAKSEFGLVRSLKTLFQGVAESFFLFLMSSVFGMIAKREAPSERDQSFLYLCCAGFVGQAALGLIGWLNSLGFMIQYLVEKWSEIGVISSAGYVLSLFANGVSSILPVLFAATIYVLYTHFVELVTFEAEVV